MSKMWITSDWHMAHRNIIDYEGRPENYEELIIQSLSVVRPGDTVINLGDLYLGNSSTFSQLFGRIQTSCPEYTLATKLLIKGNHDSLSRSKYASIGMVLLDSLVLQGIYFNHHGVQTLPSDCDSQIYGHYHSNPPAVGLARGRKFSIEEQNYKLVELSTFLNKVPLL